MAQTIKLKRSSQAGAIPSTSDLALGEIAINTADGAVYIKRGNDDIVTVHDTSILHIDTSNNRIGINKTSPNYRLDVDGNIHSTAAYIDGYIYHTGDTDTYINYSTDNIIFSAGGQVMHIKGSGKVGIGTSTPSKTFEVSYSSSDTNAGGNVLSGGGAGNGLLIRNTNSTAGSYANLDFRANNADGRISYKYNSTNDGDFHFITDNNDSIESKMVIKNAGNVGIGTGAPSDKLHVEGNIRIQTSSGNSGLKIITGNTAEGFIIFGDAQDNSMGVIAYDNATNNLIFDSNNAEVARFDSSGKLGIGTSSPAEKLEVSGGHLKVTNAGNTSIYINANGADSDASIYFEEEDGVKAKIQHDASNDSMLFTDGAFTDTMTLKAGNVGIGTTSPSEKLDIVSNASVNMKLNNTGNNISLSIGAQASAARITAGSGDRLGLGAGNTADILTIASGGNVGIGTTSPQQQLTVGTLETSSIMADGTVGIKTASDNKAINMQENSGAEGWGFGVDASGNLNFYDSANTTPSVQFIDNGGVKFNNAYTFPTSDGTSNQVLTTNGSGQLSFADVSGTSGISVTNNANNRVLTGDGTNANAEANLTFDGSTLTVTGEVSGVTAIRHANSNAQVIDNDNDTYFILNDPEGINRILIGDSGDRTTQFRNDTFKFQLANGTEKMRMTSDGRLGIGTTSPTTELQVEGTAKATKLRYTGGNETEGDEAITFRWNKPDNATNTTTWYKVCDVAVGTGLYKALSMVIKVTSANGNFGNSSDIEELYYVAEFNRSGGVQDDADFAAIYGTNGNNCQLRIYKTATGAFELQMKVPTNYRSNLLEATVNSANNATVTVTDSDLTAGTTSGGTEYLVQNPNDSGEGHYTHVFSNINVTNDIHVADSGILRMGNATSGDLQIYHDGTNSVLNNTTGNLQIYNNADDKHIEFIADDGSGGSATYFKLDGANTYTSVSKNFLFQDNVRADFGNDSDLQIYHNATDSFVFNNTGNLYLRNSANDKDILLQSDDGSGGTHTYFQLDGSQEQLKVHKNMVFFDSVKAYFGGGADFSIYHDATDSYIENTTGNIEIRNNTDDGDINFRSDNGSGGLTTYFAIDGGDVVNRFYKDAYFTDNVKAKFGSSSDLQIYHDGSASYIDDTGTGYLNIRGNGVSIDKYTGETMALFVADGAVSLYHDNSKKFETTSTGATITGYLATNTSGGLFLPDNAKILAGSSNDLEIYHDGSNSYIRDLGTGNLRIDATDFYVRNSAGTELKIAAVDDGAVTLYHDGTTKLNTTVDGVTITGNTTGSTLLLTSNEASNSAGPIIDFNRDSGSPADADYLGQLKFRGENDADQDIVYAKITAKAADVSDGTEDGAIEFTVKKAGSNNINARLSANNLDLINGTGLSVAGNATITGNLTVNGTSTTLNTATLDVEDKNITLNKGSGDTSSTADGAGITIQDAVDASTDATILWDASNDEFDFSHAINSAGILKVSSYDTELAAGHLRFKFNGGAYIDNNTTGQSLNFRVSNSSAIDTTALTINSTGQLLATPLGVSTPSFAFTNDSNTGMTRPTSDQLQLVTAGVERVRIMDTGYVGIGNQSPAEKLDVHGNIRSERFIVDGGGAMLRKQVDSWSSGAQTHDILYNGWTSSTGDYTYVKAAGNGLSGHGILQVGDLGTWIGQTDLEQGALADSNTAPIDDVFAFFRSDTSYIKGDLGVGTNAPGTKLHINSGTSDVVAIFESSDTYADIRLKDNDGSSYIRNAQGNLFIQADREDAVADTTIRFHIDDSEKARITSDGYLIVNKTSSGISTAGALLSSVGSHITRDGGSALSLNRLTSDGAILDIRKDGTTIGNIGVDNSDNLVIEGNSTHSGFQFGTNTVLPHKNGALLSSTISLGNNDYKFDSLHLSGTANVGGVTVEDAQPTLRLKDTDGTNQFTDFFMSASYALFQNRNDTANGGFIFRGNNGSANTEYMRIDPSGNVGIGISSLTEKFEVNGSINTSNQSSNFNTGTYRTFMDMISSSKIARIGTLKGANTPTGSQGSIYFTVNGTTRSVLDHDGNFMVATTTARVAEFGTTYGVSLLGQSGNEGQIQSQTNGIINAIFDRRTSDGSIIQFRKDGSEVGSIGANAGVMTLASPNGNKHYVSNSALFPSANNILDLGTSSQGYKDLYLSGKAQADTYQFTQNSSATGATDAIYRATTSTLAFKTGSSERMRLNTTGLGIGTTSPSFKLSVDSGTSDWPAHFKSTDNKAGIIIADDDTTAYFGAESSRAFMGLQAGIHANNLNVDSNGKAGLGTTAPSKKLHVVDSTAHQLQLQGSNSYWNIGTGWSGYYQDYFLLANSSGEKFVIDTNGRVGIGTLSLTNKFHVSGDARIEGSLMAGGAAASNVPARPIHIKSSGDAAAIRIEDTTSSNLAYDIRSTHGTGLLFVDVTNSATRMTLTDGGQVGINTSTANTTGGTARLTIVDSTVMMSMGPSNQDNMYIRRMGGGLFQMQTYNSNNTGHIELEPYGGKVGIGTAGTAPVATFQVEQYGIDTTSTSSTATTQIAIHTFAATDFRSARFTVQVTNSTDSTYHTTELLLVHNGTTANITEFGEIHTGSAVEATFDADISSGNVRLLATPASTDTMAFKVVCHSITT